MQHSGKILKGENICDSQANKNFMRSDFFIIRISWRKNFASHLSFELLSAHL